MSIKAEFTIDGETMTSLVMQAAAVLELLPPNATMVVDQHHTTASIVTSWDSAEDMVREIAGGE